jgi:hypothetical protein
MATFAELDALLLKLCEAHDFTAVSVGINTHQREETRFDASLHYDDPLDGLGCSQGFGRTTAEALNNAHREAVKNRPERLLVREAA